MSKIEQDNFGRLASHVASGLGALKGYGHENSSAVHSLQYVLDELLSLYEKQLSLQTPPKSEREKETERKIYPREIELNRLRAAWEDAMSSDMARKIVAKYEQDNSWRLGGVCHAAYPSDLYAWILGEWPALDIEDRTLGTWGVDAIGCGNILFEIAKQKAADL